MPAPDDLSVLHQGDQRVAPAFADREENIAGGRVEGDSRNESFGVGPQPVGRHAVRHLDRRLESDPFAGSVSAYPGIENIRSGRRNHIAVGRPRNAQVVDLRRRKSPAVRQRDFHPAVSGLYRPKQLHLLVARGFDRISGAVLDLPRRHGGVPSSRSSKSLSSRPRRGQAPNRHFRSGRHLSAREYPFPRRVSSNTHPHRPQCRSAALPPPHCRLPSLRSRRRT